MEQYVKLKSKPICCPPLLPSEALPTPEPYSGEIMDLLKEFTKNRQQEQRLDAPNLEYLDVGKNWDGPGPFQRLGTCSHGTWSYIWGLTSGLFFFLFVVWHRQWFIYHTYIGVNQQTWPDWLTDLGKYVRDCIYLKSGITSCCCVNERHWSKMLCT